MSEHPDRQYRFGDFILEPAEERLSRFSAERLDLTGKPFEVLVLLVENQGRLVRRNELLGKIWGDTAVTDQSLTEVVSRIRRTLDPNNLEKYIETVPRKGYRFVVPVSVADDLFRGGTDTSDKTTLARKRRFRPAISVLLIVLIAVGIVFGILHNRRSAKKLPETTYQSGVRLEGDGHDNLAIKTLNEVLPTDPKFAEAKLRAAWLYYQADNNDEAKRALAIVENGRPATGLGARDNATRLKIEGLEKLLADDLTDALDDFKLAAETDAADIDTWIYIADTEDIDGNLGEADSALAKCLSLDSRNIVCGLKRIDVLTDEGHYDAAIAEYNRLRKVSTNPWLDESAGYAELAKGNIPEALEHFNSLTEHDRSESLVHFMAAQDGIAAADVLQGKLSVAHRELTVAKDQADSEYEKADYLILMAEIDALHGIPGRAREELVEASNGNSSPAFAIRIARTYAIIGDYATARKFLSRQHKVALGMGLEYGAAEQFVDGIESLKMNDFQKAAEQLTTSSKMDYRIDTYYFLAQAEMALGSWAAAIDALNYVLENKARVLQGSVASLIPMAEYDLSQCYRNMGNNPEAQKHLASAQTMWEKADPELKIQFKGW